MAIAHFPEFSNFDMSLKAEYDSIFGEFPPYSDFSFGNLMIWLNQYQDLRLSLLHGNIIVECRNLFEEGKHILSVLGNNSMDATFRSLLRYLADSQQPQVLEMVPETSVEALSNPGVYDIEEERDNFNYILSTGEWSKLEGSRYGKLRRQINNFIHTYEGRFEVKKLDLRDPRTVNTIVNNIHLWDRIYTDNDVEQQESYVMSSSLSNAEALNFHNLSLFIDGQIQAISLYQKIPQSDYVIGNHTKSNYQYRYSFNYLMYELAQQLHERRVAYINFEQDLGLPGLREHKMGLRPIDFLKFYSVTPSGLNS
jgi:hypothetical protein